MYPYDIISGIGLYEIFYALALCAAIIVLRIMCDKLRFEPAVYNLALGSAIAAIAVGYCASVLTQSLYDYIETGTFRLGSGMTFYGGLIGGIASFIAVYFAVGKFRLPNGEHRKRFMQLSDIAACCVCTAHGIGRIGCFFAGCCHGRITDAWYGVNNAAVGAKTVPVQLFESAFLLALAALLIALTLRGRHVAAVYMIAYGVWRFGIEFLRADDRGATVIAALTPSQLTAILFVCAGAALAIWQRNRRGAV